MNWKEITKEELKHLPEGTILKFLDDDKYFIGKFIEIKEDEEVWCYFYTNDSGFSSFYSLKPEVNIKRLKIERLPGFMYYETGKVFCLKSKINLSRIFK